MHLTFRQKLVLALIPVVGGLIGLLAAFLKFGAATVEHLPSPDRPSVQTVTQLPQQPSYVIFQPTYELQPPPQANDDGSARGGGPPYYNSAGDRVDELGRPCGNGKYGHAYNAAQECYVP